MPNYCNVQLYMTKRCWQWKVDFSADPWWFCLWQVCSFPCNFSVTVPFKTLVFFVEIRVFMRTFQSKMLEIE